MPNDGDYRWRRDFRCTSQVSFGEKCGQKGDRAVIIYQNECWKTHPLWYPDNGFPITSEDRPWAGLICKHNHLTLVKNPVIDYTKSNANGNAGRWYVKCPTKEIDEQFDWDPSASVFLCFADEALQKMVQYDEYDPDHNDIQCLQHNYFEFQQQMLSQEEQSIASYESKWASNTDFTSISQQIERRYTRHLAPATGRREAMSRPAPTTTSISTPHLPADRGDCNKRSKKVESWLDDENNLIRAETYPERDSVAQEPVLSEQSDSDISFSIIDSIEYKSVYAEVQTPKSCPENCCLHCPRRTENSFPTDDDENISILEKITTTMYRIFINL